MRERERETFLERDSKRDCSLCLNERVRVGVSVSCMLHVLCVCVCKIVYA